MPVIVPLVTPEWYDTAFSDQGRWLVFTVKLSPSGPERVVNVADLMDAMPVPDSPLPDFAVPVALEDLHVRVLPVEVSFRVVVLADPVMAPTGLTVQVAARACDAPSPMVAAAAAVARRTLPERFHMQISSFL